MVKIDFAISMALCTLLAICFSSLPALAATESSPQITKDQWVQVMDSTPTPGQGCFQASYPSLNWQEVPCVAPPSGAFLDIGGSGTSSLGTFMTNNVLLLLLFVGVIVLAKSLIRV